MKEKKHIDALFKSRFENFEATPSPKVWSKIETQLKKERDDKKAIPIWFKLGGVAALLALLLTVGNFVFNNPTSIDNPTVTDVDQSIPAEENTTEDPLIKEHSNNLPEIASEKEKNTLDTKQIQKTTSKELIKVPTNKTETDVAVEELPKNVSNKIKNASGNLINKNTSVTPSEKEAVAMHSEKEKNAVKKQADVIKDKESLIKKDVIVSETTKTEVVTAEQKETKDASEIAPKATEKEALAVAKTEDPKKRSLLDVVNEKNTEKIIAKTNDPDNRWDVAPNFAPVYYNSLSKGSSIDPSFADNDQKGEVNFSYGVQVSYNLNKRLSIRSGANNVNLSYTTGGIELGTAPVAVALKSVDYGGKSIVLTAVDKGTLVVQNAENGGFGNITPKSTKGNTTINQHINYYEIPLELKYALVSNKFGINMIGGLSTLFLGNSEISVKATDFESVLGKSNNLSSVSFTTNIGLGFNYNISRKIQFNVEPMFKYQLNPYTDSSVDFKPYYFGIYSGFSFRF